MVMYGTTDTLSARLYGDDDDDDDDDSDTMLCLARG